MTMRDVLERGVTMTKRLRQIQPGQWEKESTRLLWELYSTEYRYYQLAERLRGRRSLIRTANRKFRRQCGLSLKGA